MNKLLREGLDCTSIIGYVFDADKQGFLRSESSLLQVPEAARNENGKVILFADKISPAMKSLIELLKEEIFRKAIISKTILKNYF